MWRITLVPHALLCDWLQLHPSNQRSSAVAECFDCAQFLKFVNELAPPTGADPGFFKRGGAHIKGLQNFGACGDRWVSEGDVPPQKQRKIAILKVNSHDLVHSFCLGHPHKVRRLISAKNRGGALGAPPSKSALTYSAKLLVQVYAALKERLLLL